MKSKSKKSIRSLRRKFLISLCWAIAVAIGLVFFQNKVSAENLSAGPLQISYLGSGPLYSEIKVLPGDSFLRDISVKNVGTISHSFALGIKNISGDLKDFVYLKPSVLGVEKWSKTISELSSLPQESQAVVDSLAPGEEVVVNLKAELDPGLGNAYQDKSAGFDLVLGDQEPEPQPIPSPTGTVSGEGEGGMGGGYLATTRRIFRTGLVAMAPSVTSTPAPSPTITPTATATGEVKGMETTVAGEKQKNWWLLLIIPALAAVGAVMLTSGHIRNLALPFIGGVIAAVLSFFIPGKLKSWIFWVILIGEFILIVVINYILLNRREAQIERVRGSRRRRRR